MLTLLKSSAKKLLSPGRVGALKGASTHAAAALSMLRGRLPSPLVGQFASSDIEELLLGAKLYGAADSEKEKDEIAVKLMQRVTTDSRYLGFLLSQHFACDVPADLVSLLRGAALYGSARVTDAYETFLRNVDSTPTVRSFYCLARCASLGLKDHRKSLEAAERGLEKHPESLSLTLMAAIACHRLGEVDAANQRIASQDSRIKAALRAEFPGIDQLQSELDEAILAGTEIRQTSYSNEVIETYWNSLLRNTECFNEFQNPWASMRCLQRANLEKSLSTVASDVTRFINFGAFCAAVDDDLAARFPAIRFAGVDFGAMTKRLNERAFNRPNLEFHDAFILDYLEKTNFSGQTPMLFHARTATLFFPRFLERFYQACAKKGVRYIALWENNSLSYSHARFYRLGTIPNGAIPYRNVMFIHDYKKALEQAGYELISANPSPSCTNLLDDYGDTLSADGHIFVLARLSNR